MLEAIKDRALLYPACPSIYDSVRRLKWTVIHFMFMQHSWPFVYSYEVHETLFSFASSVARAQYSARGAIVEFNMVALCCMDLLLSTYCVCL